MIVKIVFLKRYQKNLMIRQKFKKNLMFMKI